MSKQIECWKCEGLHPPSPPLTRDSDGKDIFKCSLCGERYKINMKNYFANRGNENQIVITMPESESEPVHESPIGRWFKKEWVYILGGLLIYFLFFK